MSTAAAIRALRTLRDECMAFGAWWLHELRDIWTQLAERVRPGYSSLFILELTESGGVMRSTGAGAEPAELRFALAADGSLPPLSQIWPERAPASANVAVILPPSRLLLCQMQLPPMRDADLASVIDLRLERELPLPREQLSVDWESSLSQGGQWRLVDVAIARQVDVERLRRELQSWKWQVTSIGMQCPDGSPRFNLLPPRVHRLNLSMGQRDWRLLAAAAVLCGACLITIAGQWWYERASLAGQLEQARTLLAKIEQQRTSIASRSKPVMALRELMTAPAASQVLAAMSIAVPANSWVYEMQIRTPAAAAASVEIEAYTPAATGLVDALEGSPAFEHVQLVQATSAGGQSGGADRVELTARLQKEPTT